MTQFDPSFYDAAKAYIIVGLVAFVAWFLFKK
jgi:hypothetical protein